MNLEQPVDKDCEHAALRPKICKKISSFPFLHEIDKLSFCYIAQNSVTVDIIMFLMNKLTMKIFYEIIKC